MTKKGEPRDETFPVNGHRVFELRRALNLTQKQLAKRSGYGLRTIQLMEKGLPKQESIIRDVAKVLGVDFEALLALRNMDEKNTKISSTNSSNVSSDQSGFDAQSINSVNLELGEANFDSPETLGLIKKALKLGFAVHITIDPRRSRVIGLMSFILALSGFLTAHARPFYLAGVGLALIGMLLSLLGRRKPVLPTVALIANVIAIIVWPNVREAVSQKAQNPSIAIHDRATEQPFVIIDSSAKKLSKLETKNLKINFYFRELPSDIDFNTKLIPEDFDFPAKPPQVNQPVFVRCDGRFVFGGIWDGTGEILRSLTEEGESVVQKYADKAFVVQFKQNFYQKDETFMQILLVSVKTGEVKWPNSESQHSIAPGYLTIDGRHEELLPLGVGGFDPVPVLTGSHKLAVYYKNRIVWESTIELYPIGGKKPNIYSIDVD